MALGERLEGGGGSGPHVPAGQSEARWRILETAYELFVRHGIRAVGVDRIVAESGVAKMTLYRHFPSKDALVLAFLELREQRWTREWLAAEIERRAAAGRDPLMAIFDALEEWFQADDYEGCPFISTLLEFHNDAEEIRKAAVRHIDTVLALIRSVARDAGLKRPEPIAARIHLLTMGAIVSASHGDREAAKRARELAAPMLESARA